MKTRTNTSHGFTLIELLIVVAIIAILAAIGLVNFQEAQVRGKVARVASDMRTIAAGLESYRVDLGAYPPAAAGDLLIGKPLVRITTPVAYLTTIPVDVFSPAEFDFAPGGFTWEGYQYKDAVTTSRGIPAETYGYIWDMNDEWEYFIHSAGPNLIWDVTPYTPYDPTNGSVSRGDILRYGP